jgi:hypothetical protein
VGSLLLQARFQIAARLFQEKEEGRGDGDEALRLKSSSVQLERLTLDRKAKKRLRGEISAEIEEMRKLSTTLATI